MRGLGQKTLTLLGVEEGELSPVVLLFFLSMAIGLFQISFEISATALFLEQFPESMVSKALLISGILGLILTVCYSKLQSVFSPSTLAKSTLGFILTATIVLWVGFDYFRSGIVIFSIFLMMGPLTILSIITFWGIAGRLFSLRQGKRLFGLAYSGQLFGIILLSSSTKLILHAIGNVENLLIISGISIFVAINIQYIISRRFKIKIKESNKESYDKDGVESNLSLLIKNKYVFMMAVFVILSMISAFFIWYSFLIVTKSKYPNTIELAGFLGFFIMSANIFSFIIRTFVHSKLLKNYGLKVVLVLIPILLGLFTIGAVTIGSIWGFDVATPQFIFFFMIISLSRLFYITLREAIQIPTFEMIYQSLSMKIRFKVQAAVDGIVNEFATIFSGIILVVLSLFSAFKLIHYSYLLTAIIAAWIFVAFKLYREYKTSLHNSLSQTKNSEDMHTKKIHISEIIEKGLTSKIEAEVLSSLKLTEIVNPKAYEAVLISQLQNRNKNIRKYTIATIQHELLFNALPFLKKIVVSETKPELQKDMYSIIESFEDLTQNSKKNQDLLQLVRSVETHDRRVAAKLASIKNNKNSTQYLLVLLRDIISKVRIDAIKTSEKMREPELISMLIDNFLIPQYSLPAANAIEVIGENALDALEQTFHKSGIQQIFRIRIIKLFGKIGGEKAIRFLLEKLHFPNREIAIAATEALLQNNYHCFDRNREIIKQLIIENAGIAAWNLSIYDKLLKNNFDKNLVTAFEDEIKSSFNVIYALLSLLYDKKSIQYIRENIESQAPEKINYAIELMDIFVEEELKACLFTLFEDISLHEKIKRLQDYFPLKNLEPIQLIEEIINRDSTNINRWTKACGLINYKNSEQKSISNSLVAHLFNPDSLMREIAGEIIYSIDKDSYLNYTKRIDKTYKQDLDAVLIKKIFAPSLEHIFNIKQIKQFSRLSDFDIAQIAKDLQFEKIERGSILLSNSDLPGVPLFIIQKGQVQLIIENEIKQVFRDGQIIDEVMLNESINFQLIVGEETHIYRLNKTARNQLINDNETIAESIAGLHKDIIYI